MCSQRLIWARGVALWDENDRAYRMAGSHTDITEQIRYEEKSRERELYLRTILETTQDGFWIIGEQTFITDVNDAYCHMTGYSRDEIVRLTIADLEVIETPEEIKNA